MFNRPKCKRCNEKVSKKYSFCPHCGYSLKGKSSELFEPTLDSLGLPFPLNHLLKNMTKQVEKQLKDLNIREPTFDEQNQNPVGGFPGGTMGVSINIDPKSGRINVKSMDRHRQPIETKSNIPKSLLTEEMAEKLSSLPKAEPETNVTRLTNKLIYELELPGVKKEDIIIRKFENSIEIKAYSSEKSYFKLIPLSLPLLKSNLKEGKLILELKL